jgi:Ca-activated chloride channel family protein
VLESTPATEKETILDALNHLDAGGSTAGFDGLVAAYGIAEKNFIKNGNNRIFLCTDGDFNVGPSSDAEMARLVETYRDKGIAITVLGFGMGNYKDSKSEIIADKGNGNYFYIDDITEAQKTLVDNMAATMYTIAKDVKIQVEFNPAYVDSYRLIGYENRLLNNQDFEDDTKDAGELGAGHTVTAVYQIVPSNGASGGKKLKYQDTKLSEASASGELVTVKFRFKKPGENKSREIVKTIMNDPKSFSEASQDFKFTASVAGWGMLLRGSKYKGNLDYDRVIEIASANTGNDKNGYRSEFVHLVKQSKALSSLSENKD